MLSSLVKMRVAPMPKDVMSDIVKITIGLAVTKDAETLPALRQLRRSAL